MCGIICTLLPSTPKTCLEVKDHIPPNIHNLLCNRGPDDTNTLVSDGLIFGGYVLWQQGLQISIQPAVSKRFILLFNGDIYNTHRSSDISDTTWLINKLEGCKEDSEILNLFKNLKGPYSVIFYNKINRALYFFRDSLGRNSLLLEKDTSIIRILSTSSISKGDTITMELPPVGIFKLNMDSKNEIVLFPWKLISEENYAILENFFRNFQLNLTKITNPLNPDWLFLEKSAETYDFSEIIANIDDCNIFPSLLQNQDVDEVTSKLTQLIKNSVKERIVNTAKYCSECIKLYLQEDKFNITCLHSKIGILFSGGIDCTILAALAHQHVNVAEPIDLINVAFQSAKESVNMNWNVPDRLSAIESFNELRNLYPSRTWNLVEVNVTRDELNSILKSHIRHLIHPLKTVLDESLGCAFWFAAKGNGLLNGTRYQSNCRVVLVGSGADELFGGYTRHRNAYLRCPGNHVGKTEAVQKELDLDWERMPSRNLGRDDRVIGDNGRTARAPFIEENMVSFVRNLSPTQKCCFNLKESVGDKLLLRLCGFKLGLTIASKFKKRAIQFGSRIANKSQNAKDLSANLID